MNKFWSKMRELVVSEEGATATEYAVMLALIIVVALVAIQTLGNRVDETFTNVGDALEGAGGTGGTGGTTP